MAGIEDTHLSTPTRSASDRAGDGPGEPPAAHPASALRDLGRRTLRGGRRWAHDLVHEWQDDRVGGLAAEIAFFALLSIFPGLVAVAGILGVLQGVVGEDLAADAEREVVGFFERILTDEASDTVDAVRGLFRDATPSALTLGGAASIWAASRAFAAVTRAMDVAYDITERRSYVRLRALALGLALGSVLVGALMLAMLVVGPLLGTGQEVADDLGFGGGFATFWTFARWPLMAMVLTAWAATMYHVAPNHSTPWRWDLPGAVVCAVGWGLLSLGFSTYLQVAASTNQVLGVLGGSVILVLWLYLLAIALLVGGEINAILAVRRGLVAGANGDIAGTDGSTGTGAGRLGADSETSAAGRS